MQRHLYSWSERDSALFSAWKKISRPLTAALAPNGAVGHHEQAEVRNADESVPLPTPTPECGNWAGV